MARHNSHGRLSKKVADNSYPKIFTDIDADFASIKIAPGIEKKSYVRDGFIFCENAKGEIIEIQILNLNRVKKSRRTA